MRVVVNKIIPFSSVDGPGNRTSIFLQGCNIDCKYCHNPETRKVCIHCGICVLGCPSKALSIDQSGKVRWNPSLCIDCDQCIHVCPHDSSPKVMNLTAEETYELVKKQIPFIRGITVSGGECMLYPDFLMQLFKLARKDNLSTLIDSNGTILFEDYPKLMEVADGVMLDIKAFFDKDHINVTGSSNKNVLRNAVYLGETGKLFEVRCVIVPDLYDGMLNVENMADFLLPLYRKHEFRIKLIAYRKFGVRKQYSGFVTPSDLYLKAMASMLEDKGFKNIIII